MNCRLKIVVWELSFGNLFGNGCLRILVLELSLGNCRLELLAWECFCGNFRLETFAWALLLGNFSLEALGRFGGMGTGHVWGNGKIIAGGIDWAVSGDRRL